MRLIANPQLTSTYSLGTACLLIAASLPLTATADTENRFAWELETGGAWFSRNDVRIPNDAGTRFDLMTLTDSGPDPYIRLYASYAFNSRHSVRINLAPLEVSGTGMLDAPVHFVNSTFAANTPTQGTFKFNTYRLTYRYQLPGGERWDWGVGAALLVRDAKIELHQEDVHEVDDDLGLVPLLHAYGAYRFNNQLSLVLDVEGAAASAGRAIDASLKFYYQLPSGLQLSMGYRTLEGGADNDSLYTFAWVHYAALGVGYTF
ncbi:MAG TPA: hypothetical protein VIC08_13050 [Cellvibrionaceae bacterium]